MAGGPRVLEWDGTRPQAGAHNGDVRCSDISAPLLNEAVARCPRAVAVMSDDPWHDG